MASKTQQIIDRLEMMNPNSPTKFSEEIVGRGPDRTFRRSDGTLPHGFRKGKKPASRGRRTFATPHSSLPTNKRRSRGFQPDAFGFQIPFDRGANISLDAGMTIPDRDESVQEMIDRRNALSRKLSGIGDLVSTPGGVFALTMVSIGVWTTFLALTGKTEYLPNVFGKRRRR